MQKYKIELLPPAWAELNKISNMHMELVSIKSADKITSKILDTLDLLTHNPYMGAVSKNKALTEQGYRVLICGKYLCFYKVNENLIEVYHIVDGRRDYPKLIKD